jgi:hypothetical protein
VRKKKDATISEAQGIKQKMRRALPTERLERGEPSSPFMPRPHMGEQQLSDDSPRIVQRRSSLEGLQLALLLDVNDDPLPKRVSFCAESSVYSYPAVPKQLYSLIYWDRKELGERNKIQYRCVKKHAGNSKVADCIYQLHGYTKQTHQEAQDCDAKQLLASTDCRGLEHLLSPLIQSHRDSAIDKLLEIQRDCDPVDAAIAMHVWSLRVSAASTRFARHLAEMDALEANEDERRFVYRSQSNASSSSSSRASCFRTNSGGTIDSLGSLSRPRRKKDREARAA